MRMRKRFCLVTLLFAFNSSLFAATARSKIQFIATNSTGAVSVAWPSSGKPIISFPFNENNRPTGLAIFEGHEVGMGQFGKDIVGGTLLVQPSRGRKTLMRDVWKSRLAEIGLIDLNGEGNDEIYFASMEGNTQEYWHYNLFSPKKSALITLNYEFGHSNPPNYVWSANANFNKPEYKKEQEFLKEIAEYKGSPIIVKNE